jgi:LPS-assembly protein
MYGAYAASRRSPSSPRGILGSSRLKLNESWQLLGAVRYDLRANQLSQTQLGVGYVDDCLILALNYITDYAYSGSVNVNHTFMMQISLRTLGGIGQQGAPRSNTEHRWQQDLPAPQGAAAAGL